MQVNQLKKLLNNVIPETINNCNTVIFIIDEENEEYYTDVIMEMLLKYETYEVYNIYRQPILMSEINDYRFLFINLHNLNWLNNLFQEYDILNKYKIKFITLDS